MTVDYAPIFSQAAGGVFVVGGNQPETGAPKERIWFQPLGGAWENLEIQGYQVKRVLAATYSYADRQLWILDRFPSQSGERVRLSRVDPVFLTAEILVEGPYGDTTPFLAVDVDGSMLLFANAPSGPPRAFRFVLERDGSSVKAIQRLAGPPTSVARTPMVDDGGYSLVHAGPDGTLQISRVPELSRVCCDGTSCANMTECNFSVVAAAL